MRRQAANIDAARRAVQIEREEAERQRAFERALIEIGAGISSGRGILPTAPVNPGNRFKSYNYNVLGETVSYPISSVQICPPMRNFIGTVGILQ
jgi:hypothetical protein|tara:strand:+ start:898 stop:1179 length:282 start_codon:yes stop_codon:yes gene_type:complete